jgi:hypothetical protein
VGTGEGKKTDCFYGGALYGVVLTSGFARVGRRTTDEKSVSLVDDVGLTWVHYWNSKTWITNGMSVVGGSGRRNNGAIYSKRCPLYTLARCGLE